MRLITAAAGIPSRSAIRLTARAQRAGIAVRISRKRDKRHQLLLWERHDSHVVAIMACAATCFCGSCLKKVRMFYPEELDAVGEGVALIDIAFEPVSSNRSLRCGETEFSARRQRGRNDLGDLIDAGAETKSR